MNLTTHFGLVLKLRMSGSIPLLTLYAIMEWLGADLTSIFLCCLCVFNFVNYVLLLLGLCILFVMYVLFVYSVSLCSVYCLCVNVYCTTATGCQPNCS